MDSVTIVRIYNHLQNNCFITKSNKLSQQIKLYQCIQLQICFILFLLFDVLHSVWITFSYN